MNVLAHIDPAVLERELLTRVDAAHPRRACGRTLVLVPTNRLAGHVQRKLAELRPAWLGLEVLPFRALGRQVLERAGSTLHVVSSLLLAALLRRLLGQRPRNVWSRFVERRPGAAGHLLATLGELREAGIAPADVAAGAGDPRERDLAEIYGLYDAALAEHAAAGWTDDTGLARAARPHAAGFARGASAVLVHGAYELLGVHLDLLSELEREAPVTILVPVGRGTRATAHAERFARSFLGASDEALGAVTGGSPDGARASRLAALYDEDATAPPAGEPVLRFRHAQGAMPEVKFAVREALAAVRDGCPATEIVITARTLEPYAAALEEALDDADLPWTSSLASPLRRHPVVREFLLLLRVLDLGFPRQDVVQLLQSRHVRWKALGCDPPAATQAERLSREAQLLDGLDEWTAELVRWAASPRPTSDPAGVAAETLRAEWRVEQARGLERAVRALDAALPRAQARWTTHAAAWTAAFETIFEPPEGPAAEALREALDVMADLEARLGDRREVEFGEARAWFEQAVDASRLALDHDDRGGIRVLDAMQLRGLTFRHVHLLGLNSGLYPRVPREDPFLSDALRRELRRKTGRPLGVKAEGAEEEHQLLVALVGAARERIDVSWQRADESGRAKSVSLALRELARLVHGGPEIERLRAEATHLPSHPAHWLECLVAETGLLAPAEEQLLAALHCRAADAAERLAARFDALAPGLHMLRATQSFEPAGGEFDGRIGPFRRAKELSVSEIEQLGTCPLQFLFRSILDVRPLEPPATVFGMASNAIGNSIHALLHEIYATLRDEGRFGGPAEALVERGLALLEERRERVFGEVGRRAAQSLPLLWESQRALWGAALRRFVEDDLGRIAEDELRPVSLETLATATLDFGEGAAEPVRGKVDRLLEGPEGRRVGDYKASTSLSRRVDATIMLKAQTLQVPLYRMLAGGDAEVELLAVHPALRPGDEGQRVVFRGFPKDNLELSFRQSVRVLLGLRRDGVYPFHDDWHCSWCDYKSACRRNHPPTVDREAALPDADGYRAVLTKSTKSPDGR